MPENVCKPKGFFREWFASPFPWGAKSKDAKRGGKAAERLQTVHNISCGSTGEWNRGTQNGLSRLRNEMLQKIAKVNLSSEE